MLIRSTASLLRRGLAANRFARSAGALSTASASGTIVEDDADYGFGKSIPDETLTLKFNSIPDETTPEEYIEEGEETRGEWTGCTRKFLAPLSVSQRGNDILNNPLFNKFTGK